MQKIATLNEAWQRKYPEQVVLAVTRSEDGRINIMTIGWVCIVSDDPGMFLIGIDDQAYTLELIRKNKEFVLAYPAKDMAAAALYCGTVHGHDLDKGAACGLQFEPGSVVNVPLLSDAVANFECRFVAEYRPGNCPLIVGEIVSSHVNCDDTVKRLINAAAGYDLQ